MDELKELCKEYVDGLLDSNCDHDSKLEHYIFEQALKACEGDDVFDLVCERIDERDRRRDGAR